MSLAKASRNTAWLSLGSLASGLTSLVTIPLVIRYLGPESFGLLTLATVLNGYLGLMMLGVTVGMVKHCAEWLASGEMQRLDHAIRSNILVYLGVGAINAALLFVLAFTGGDVFNVPAQWQGAMTQLFLIAGAVALISWPFSTVDQLLHGAEELDFVARLNITSSFIRLAGTLLLIQMDAGLIALFLLTPLSLIVLIPFKLRRWSRYADLRSWLRPGWFWRDYKPVLEVSAHLSAQGIFSTSYYQLRPVILGMQAPNALQAVAAFQVFETLTRVLTQLHAVLTAALLPASSRAFASGDRKVIEFIAYQVSRWSWLLVCPALVFLALNGEDLLRLVGGESLVQYGGWFSLWVLSYLSLSLGPLNAMIQGSGRLAFLTILAPINTLVSLGACWVLAPSLGLGGAVVGNLIYFFAAFPNALLYYYPRVLKLRVSTWLLRVLLPVTLVPLPFFLTSRILAVAVGTDYWMRLAISSLVGGLSYCYAVWRLVLSGEERAMALQAALGLIGRRRDPQTDSSSEDSR